MEKDSRWRILRDHPEVEFVLCDLPDGVQALYVQEGPFAAILVNKSLGQVERLAAMLHELAHHERNGGCHRPDTPPLLRVASLREERRVQGIVADRLVPPADLRSYVKAREDDDQMVVARDVAEDFDVPVDVAHLALERLVAGF